jgi:hypothetical protein
MSDDGLSLVHDDGYADVSVDGEAVVNVDSHGGSSVTVTVQNPDTGNVVDRFDLDRPLGGDDE